MSSNRAKGTRWESEIVRYLRGVGWPDADRLPLSGSKDRGDVTLGNGAPLVIEAKNAQRIELAAWVDEAIVEADNAAERDQYATSWTGVAWIKRKGRQDAAAGYVVMDGQTFAQLLRDAGY